MRNEAIIEVRIVWKAVHQDDRRFFAGMLSRVYAVLVALYERFFESHLRAA
jgi:hypothetical protein